MVCRNWMDSGFHQEQRQWLEADKKERETALQEHKEGKISGLEKTVK